MSNVSIELDQTAIPVSEEVSGACEMLGLDPLSIANEGKLCCFVPDEYASDVLKKMKELSIGQNASIIGKVIEKTSFKVFMNTLTGGKKIINMPSGENLPRIC